MVLDEVFLLGEKVLVHLGQDLLLELGVVVAHHHACHVLPVLGHLVLHLGRGLLLVVLVALLRMLLGMLLRMLRVEEIIFLGLVVLLVVGLIVVLLGRLLLILIGLGRWLWLEVVAPGLIVRVEVDAVVAVHADVGVVVGHVLRIAHICGRLGLQSGIARSVLSAILVVIPTSVVGQVVRRFHLHGLLFFGVLVAVVSWQSGGHFR